MSKNSITDKNNDSSLEQNDELWRKKLTPDQYRILRQKGTEPAFTGKLVDNHEEGMYLCAGCGNPLFPSDTKFNSGTGWPSFYDVIQKGNVEFRDDDTYGMHRVEVTCAKCGGHLGHVFDDGPKDKTGKRFCINSCALDFEPKGRF